ncbi:MAG: sensor histidine kinase [Gemmatimonas sp.]
MAAPPPTWTPSPYYERRGTEPPPAPVIALDQALLDRLYPFHVAVDHDYTIVATGRVIARLLPECGRRPRFDEVFAFQRPLGVSNFQTFAAAQRQVVSVQARSRSDLRLKGEILGFPEHNRAVLLAVPWMRSERDMESLDLKLSDFALSDATPDLLFLIETQAALLADAKASAERLAAARDAAQHASRAKTEFLANMSHELRTPLNAIIGFSEYLMMLGEQALSAKLMGYINDIHSSGRHLLAIVDDLLDLSRIEAGRLTLEETEFDLAATVAHIVQTMEPQATAAAVRLGVSAAAEPIRVRADERLMRQIVINLVANAVKYNRPQGTVTVSLARREEGVEIAVADTGIGIETDAIERLFQPFHRGDVTVARQVGGVGLGLSIVKSLVEMHGGTVAMESAVGAGTTVRVLLPPDRLVG